MMRRPVLHAVGVGLLGLAAVFAALACESGPGAVVAVDLREWAVVPVPLTVPAGKVTFRVRNTGAMAHELTVIRTDLAPGALPLAGAGVDETQTGAVGGPHAGGHVEIAPGGTLESTLTLAARRYVLICNLPGHYQAGMHVVLVVR